MIITEALASPDFNRTTPGPASASTVYSPEGSNELPTWNPKGTCTFIFCDPWAYIDTAAKRATLQLRISCVLITTFLSDPCWCDPRAIRSGKDLCPRSQISRVTYTVPRRCES